MPDFAELEKEVADARQRLGIAQTALREAREAAAPFQVGDVVLAFRRIAWEEAIVRRVEVWMAGEAWYHVSYRVKSGQWGKGSHYAYGSVKALDA